MEEEKRQNPQLVLDAIAGRGGRLKELTIYRYAWLERLGSPFVTGGTFDIENLVPSLWAMMADMEELKSMRGVETGEVVEHSLEWIDSRCSLSELPSLIDELTRCFRDVSRAAPSGGSEKNAMAERPVPGTDGFSTPPTSPAPSSDGA